MPSPPKTPPKTPPKSSGKSGPGRPKRNVFRRVGRGFKTAATGETRNSPMTAPNIIFWLGLSLIIASGWSSNRIQNLFKTAWDTTWTLNKDEAGKFVNDLRVTFVQFVFLFVVVITSRVSPILARMWMVMIGGLWILWIMKNPQVIQLLQAAGTPTGGKELFAAGTIAGNALGKSNNTHPSTTQPTNDYAKSILTTLQQLEGAN